jgi:hypothetical protein
MDTLSEIWQQVRSIQTPPPWWLSVATILVALALIVPRPVWPITRNVVTIAHEGGHALVALLTGRRLAGIQLHSDTSGVTVSAGKPSGLGMILTAFAGYVAPSLFGLGAAWLLAGGRVLATLWFATILLALMFLMIRNLYGALTVAVTGTLIFAISWWTPNIVQSAFASLLVWFLLISGPRPVYELHLKRRDGLAPDSDADQLARLTAIPGIIWVGLFAAVTIASLGYAARLLLL